MSLEEINDSSEGNFHLSKWYLDFVGENGEAMIFYVAKLKWYGWSVSYTSWLHRDPATGLNLKSRLTSVQIPLVKNNFITWSDPKFGVSGTWEALASMIQARIFSNEAGFLDWNCFQPASKVDLRINDRILKGKGYAELLNLTVPPWKIPMDELRWGHFISIENNMVWIELREKTNLQWLWLNGEKIENSIIEDSLITLPEQYLVLKLDQEVLLESEKKIFSLVQKIFKCVPWINRLIPLNFLMAEEFKWLSKGRFQSQNNTNSSGMAIHELVNFKA
jgi:hypothetical protein